MNPRTLLAILLLGAPAAIAQDASPPGAQPTPPPPSQDPPSLDELLDLEPEPADEGAEDPASRDLARRLSDEELAQEFQAAVQLMGETADRLDNHRDTGLTTQRLQEDVVRKLDMLISQAARRQQQQQQQQSQSRRNQDSQSQQPQDRQQNSANAGAQQNNGMVDPPARRDGELGALPTAGGAAWGALPERIRDALLQGRADRFSAMYRSMTEEYYRRLAEEPR